MIDERWYAMDPSMMFLLGLCFSMVQRCNSNEADKQVNVEDASEFQVIRNGMPIPYGQGESAQ